MKLAYADANFLVAYLYRDHEWFQKAKECMLDALSNGYTILVSPLTLDEVWKSLKGFSRESRAKDFSKFSSEFEKQIKPLIKKEIIKLISFSSVEKGFEHALQGAAKFNLKPRDSFHYAYAKEFGAILISGDSSFTTQKLDIVVVDFTD